MKNLFGQLAFAGLIAAQFLAVVVTSSERFEGSLRGGGQRGGVSGRGMIPRKRLRLRSYPILVFNTLIFRRWFRTAQGGR
jgi:hypothetical protein